LKKKNVSAACCKITNKTTYCRSGEKRNKCIENFFYRFRMTAIFLVVMLNMSLIVVAAAAVVVVVHFLVY
jgi:hypothetical protein